MASAVKAKLQGLASGSSNSSADAAEADKYKLLVTAGPSYDQATHETVKVNTDTAVFVENEFVRAKIKVRVREFKGLPSATPTSSPYFDDPSHEKDLYSVGFSFVPKQDLPSVDTVWGNDFDHPIRNKLPPGFNTAFKIVKEFIDPGLECDAYADEPWLYGPSLSCWFAFWIGDRVGQDADFPAPDDKHAMKEGGDGEGEEIRHKLSIPDNGDKRRKFFLSAQHRENFVFEKGRQYQGDFYNPYIDFPNFALKLPGFTMKVIKYIDHKSHCLRYVFKNRKTGDLYFSVHFHLLWGDKLEQEIKKDDEQQQGGRKLTSGPPTNGVIEGPGQPDGQARGGADFSGERHEGNATSSVFSRASSGGSRHDDQPTQVGSVPSVPQLHAGDMNAAADHDASQVVTRMLQNTSTGDQQGTKLGLLSNNVD